MIKFSAEPAATVKDAQPVAKREAAPLPPVTDLLDGGSTGAGAKPKPAKARIANRGFAKSKPVS